MLFENTKILEQQMSSNYQINRHRRGADQCSHLSYAEVAARGRDRAEEVARHLLKKENQKSGREMRWGNRLSMSLCIEGEHKGCWTDFSTGERGDILDLVERELSLSKKEAVAWLLNFLGSDLPFLPADDRSVRVSGETTRQSSHGDLAERLEDARAIWDSAVPLDGTPAEVYLQGRLAGHGVPPKILAGDAMRYCHCSDMPKHRRMYGPTGALIAAMTDPHSNTFCGVQRTYLTETGSRYCRKGERLAARPLGKSGTVRLFDDAEVTHALAIGEGIETVISAHLLFDSPPCWAALSAWKLASFPVLSGIQTLWIFSDADLPNQGRIPGLEAAKQLARRWRSHAPDTEIILLSPRTPGTDFNDLLNESLNRGVNT